MNAVLRQLNMIPGVRGLLLSDADGGVVAHAFRKGVAGPKLAEAAQVLADGSAGLRTACGEVGLIDMRFGEARIVVKPLTEAHLLFLCDKGMSLEPLLICAAVAAPKLERFLATRAMPPLLVATPPAAEPGRLHALVQSIEEAITRRHLDRYKVRGEIALRAGFTLDSVEPDTLDEPEGVERLRDAAHAVLGEPI